MHPTVAPFPPGSRIGVADGLAATNRFHGLLAGLAGEYRLDAYLDGILMVFPHQDVPGLIGFLGTECGRHGVNIASMNLGRLKPGGDAVAVDALVILR